MLIGTLSSEGKSQKSYQLAFAVSVAENPKRHALWETEFFLTVFFPLRDMMIILMNSMSLSHTLMRTSWLNIKKEATDQSWTRVSKEFHY